MEITLLRHGETPANAAGVWQGHGSVGLSHRGRRQAEKVAARVSAEDYDLVVTSDLERAVETAKVLGGPAEVDPAWREIDLGAWEGLTRQQVAERYPDELAALRSGEPIRFGGGESLPEFRARVEGALEVMQGRLDDGARALIVTHGGVVMALVRAVWGLEGWRRGVGPVDNTALSTLNWQQGLRVTRYNDAGHLEPWVGWAGERMRDSDPVVTLVRHGLTDANVAGRWQGHSDRGMNQTGRRQVAQLSAWWGRTHGVFSSPLGRALETARALVEGGEPVTIDDLKEISMGAWEERSGDEIQQHWPELWRRIYEEGEDLPRGGDGETWEAMKRRVTRAVEELSATNAGPVTVVSHGAAIRAYVASLLGLGWEGCRRLAVPANASVSQVVMTAEGPVLAAYSVTPHLG